jgi:histidyl-tRNA synthetase
MGRELRQALPGLGILTHCGGGKYNAQLKKAFTLGASCAVVLEGEGPQSLIKIKVLEEGGATVELAASEAGEWLRDFFSVSGKTA